MKRFAVLVLGMVVALALSMPAGAAGAPQWKTSGNGHWYPQIGYNSQHGLQTMSYPDAAEPWGYAWGGMYFRNMEMALADLTTASFDFKASVTGGSGGSPRLVFWLSDGGNIQLLPLTWTADAWTSIDETSNWDSSGPYMYQQPFAAVKAAHAGTTIEYIEVVNDSGWLYPTETVVLDNIEVNGVVARGPGKSS